MPIVIKRLGLVFFVIALGACAVRPFPDAHAGTLPANAAAVPADRPFINARALIIVRHADIDVTKKATLGNALPLLPEGQERAKGLIPMLQDAGITRIVTSPALRTQQTAAPVAAALHLEPEEGPGTAADLIQLLTRTAKPSQTILIVHHHSVMPSILAELGFKNEPEAVDGTEFDRVYVVLPDPERRTYQLFRLRYGGKWE
jgi:phosphohistidine phosphatase SixA